MIPACAEYVTRLELLVDGELPPDDVPGTEAHVARCEACAAYVTELRMLSDTLARLCPAVEAPGIAEAVAEHLRRRLFLKDTLLLVGLIALKVLDVCGLFGSGITPRLVVAALIVGAFTLTRVNPFRLIDNIAEDIPPLAAEGVEHGRA